MGSVELIDQPGLSVAPQATGSRKLREFVLGAGCARL
jgi:hypothetical protein